MSTVKQILKTVFGYDDFRPLQAEIISHVMQRKNALVIMPTGGGKSLCYQIPALIFPGLTIVVSPLISLMQDQVTQLHELQVPAVVLNSALSPGIYRRNLTLLGQNKIKLVYMAPETLLKPHVMEVLVAKPIDCLAVDEAHCISEWGHDFRPEYRQLAEVRKRFPKAVCMALTATATPRVRADIKTMLDLDGSDEFIGSFNRPNLFLKIDAKLDPMDQIRTVIEQFSGQSGIIYCATRKQVDTIAEKFGRKGHPILPYHAGLSEAERKSNQEKFIKDDIQLIAATIAFGMGIDKPNVRFVIHYDLPKNIEGYYQEIGRAGRDGLNAHCLLLFSYADIHKIRYFIDRKSTQEQRVAQLQLNALLGLVEANGCRREPLLKYFGENYFENNCGMCDNCLAQSEDQTDVTVPAQKFLSCITRTGEIFGAGYIIDVLRGSDNRRIKNNGHHELSTYAIGTDLSKKEWFFLSRQFIRKGLLIQDMEHGSLKLTPKAWEVMRGKEKVLAPLKRDQAVFKKPKPKEITGITEYDHDLFEILRKKRKELADATNVPPYIIFSDRTLAEMAFYFPQSEESLLDIQGIGAVKLEKYGAIFLDIIRRYCGEKNAGGTRSEN